MAGGDAALLEKPRDGACMRPPVAVIVVGPPLDRLGGMTAVVRQTLGLDYGGRYVAHHLPTTHAVAGDEHAWGKLRRHHRQVDTLRRVMRESRAGVVHVHTCSGFSFYRSIVDLQVARQLSRRTVLHVHGARFEEFYAEASGPARWCIGWGLSRADRVVALSPSWRETLLAMAPSAAVTVVENAVAPVEVRGDRDPTTHCQFVMLARMDVWKGIDDALEAARALSQRGVAFRLTLAGPEGTAGNGASLYRRIRSLELDDCVHYVGAVEGVAKARLLGEADVYLMPSHHEGMPISVLEALAHGLPVVATRVGSLPEVIEEGVTGRLVPPQSPSALADAMSVFACDESLRRRVGRAARGLAASRFSLKRFERDLVAIYDELTGGDTRSGDTSVSCDGVVPRRPGADASGVSSRTLTQRTTG